MLLAGAFLSESSEAIDDSTQKHCRTKNDRDNVVNSQSVAEHHCQDNGRSGNSGKHLVGFDELEHFASSLWGLRGISVTEV